MFLGKVGFVIKKKSSGFFMQFSEDNVRGCKAASFFLAEFSGSTVVTAAMLQQIKKSLFNASLQK